MALSIGNSGGGVVGGGGGSPPPVSCAEAEKLLNILSIKVYIVTIGDRILRV